MENYKIIEKLPESFKKIAIKCEYFDLGLGWYREDALKLLEEIESLEFGIWGGDVWKKENENFVPDNANWYCNNDRNEDWNEFVKRSRKIAIDYIRNYPEKTRYKPIFSFSFDKWSSLIFLGDK